jgi:hypothetical protein
VGNTVGSLTQRQKSIILGSVLGDGHLRRVKNRANAFLEINHSSKQKEYVDWKYVELESLVNSSPRLYKNGRDRTAYRFTTRQHPELTAMMDLFYQDGKKIIPDNLILDEIALAVWYMDDGSKCRDNDIYLNTQQLDQISQKKLVVALKKCFGLEIRMNKDKHYMRLRFLKRSVPLLMNLIQNYVVPSMGYKIKLDPVETDPEVNNFAKNY